MVEENDLLLCVLLSSHPSIIPLVRNERYAGESKIIPYHRWTQLPLISLSCRRREGATAIVFVPSFFTEREEIGSGPRWTTQQETSFFLWPDDRPFRGPSASRHETSEIIVKMRGRSCSRALLIGSFIMLIWAVNYHLLSSLLVVFCIWGWRMRNDHFFIVLSSPLRCHHGSRDASLRKKMHYDRRDFVEDGVMK
jgi:hypothetical protein